MILRSRSPARAPRAPAGHALRARRVGAAAARARIPAEPRPRRPRHAGRLRAGAAAAQGAARHRPGDRRRVRHARGRRRASRRRPTATSTSSSTGRRSCSIGWRPRRGRRRRRPPGKAIVEHTAINPNKAAHIGHLRNAALGDTLVRVLRFRGIPVEVQNYIDDTGVQVADVVVGFRRARGQDARRDPRRSPTPPASTTTAGTSTRASPSGTTATRSGWPSAPQTLHDIEHGGNENADDRRLHRRPHRPLPPDDDGAAERRLRPAHVGRRHPAPEVLGAGVRRAEGQGRGLPADRRPAGRLLGDADSGGPRRNSRRRNSQGPDDAERPTPERTRTPRSARRSSSARTAWSPTSARTSPISSGSSACSGATSTTACSSTGRTDRCGRPAAPTAQRDHPPFGGAAYVYNVIDVRQSYLQKLLKQALIAVGHPEGAERSHHFSYEMVALSHATARELGYAPPPDSEDAKRPFVEVSGRKGLGVKADDLLDTLIAQGRRPRCAKRNAGARRGRRHRADGADDRASPRCATS